MPVVKLPGNLGVAITTGTQADADDMKATIEGRHAFVQKYCQEQGWGSTNLSINQIMQVRQQEGWKNPCQVKPIFEVVRFLLNGWEVCSSGTILPNGSLRYVMPDGDSGTVRTGRWREVTQS